MRSRKASNTRDRMLKYLYRSEIWQAHWQQQCCRGVSQITERYDYFKYKSRGFETSRDLAMRRLIGYWKRSQVVIDSCAILLIFFTVTSQLWANQMIALEPDKLPWGMWTKNTFIATQLNATKRKPFVYTKYTCRLVIPLCAGIRNCAY